MVSNQEIELLKCKCGVYFSSSWNIRSFTERYGDLLTKITKKVNINQMLFFIVDSDEISIFQSHPAAHEYCVSQEKFILCKTCETILGNYFTFQEEKYSPCLQVGVINLVQIKREKISLGDIKKEKKISVHFKDACETLTQIKQIYTLFEAISSFSQEFSQNDISYIDAQINDINSSLTNKRMSSLLRYSNEDTNTKGKQDDTKSN